MEIGVRFLPVFCPDRHAAWAYENAALIAPVPPPVSIGVADNPINQISHHRGWPPLDIHTKLPYIAIDHSSFVINDIRLTTPVKGVVFASIVQSNRYEVRGYNGSRSPTVLLSISVSCGRSDGSLAVTFWHFRGSQSYGDALLSARNSLSAQR
jgi:hypothetical protein